MKVVIGLLSLLVFASSAHAGARPDLLPPFIGVDLNMSYSYIWGYERGESYMNEKRYCYGVAVGDSAMNYAKIMNVNLEPIFKEMGISEKDFRQKLDEGNEHCLDRK